MEGQNAVKINKIDIGDRFGRRSGNRVDRNHDQRICAREHEVHFHHRISIGKRYGEQLRAAGVAAEYICYDGMIHGFWHYGKRMDAAGAALDKCIEGLRGAFAT